MAAFDAGFDKFHAEQEAEKIAQQEESKAKREQAGVLFKILNSSAARLQENHLSPIVRDGELFIVLGDDDFAKVSPAAAGDLFEIKVGSKAQTFSGNAEECIEELGKIVAKTLFARTEAEKKARFSARRSPRPGGWMSN